MKRSSSKLLGKAGSMRNINKQAYKFKLELHIESVEKIINGNEICITWERNGKITSTKPAKVDKTSRNAHFGGQVISQEITMFKKKKEGSSFDEKVFRLAARNNNENGKVIGRIDINFAEYVDIPSFSKRVGAALSNGGRVIMRVESTFLGEAKGRKAGSRGTSSIGSSTFEVAEDSHSNVDDSDRLNQNDFDDLDVGAEDSLETPSNNQLVPSSRPPVQSQPPRRTPAPIYAPKEEPIQSSVLSRRKAAAPSPGREPRARIPELTSRARNASPAPVITNDIPIAGPPLRQRPSGQSRDYDSLNTAAGPSKAEFDKMKRENRTLQRINDDLNSRMSELEDQLETRVDQENGASVEELTAEVQYLKTYAEDLEVRLKREPLYSDVVRELREAKMALAILTLEKDELVQELRRLKRN